MKHQNGALVGIGLIVIIAVIVNRVHDSISSYLSATATSATAVQGNTLVDYGSAFQLSAVTPLILGAGLILTVILGFAAAIKRMR